MLSIRTLYGVPAKRGMRVTHLSGSGVITGSAGNSLRIRTDDGGGLICHPNAVTYPATPPARHPATVTLSVPALEPVKGTTNR